jgi:hypothetical protein
VRRADRTVARVARSVRVGERVVRQDAHYIVADAAGVRHFDQIQTFTLFEPAEYEAAFRQAGCEVEYIEREDILDGRGLFVGVRR